MKYYITDNTAPAVPLSEIPEASYAEFYADLAAKLADARYHIAHYFALPLGDRLRFFCLLLDDAEAKVLIASHAMELSLIHISEPTRLDVMSDAVFCL